MLHRNVPLLPNIPRNATSVTDDRSECVESQQVGGQDRTRQGFVPASNSSRRELSKERREGTIQSQADGGEAAAGAVSRQRAQRAAEVRSGHIGRAIVPGRRDCRRSGKGSSRVPGSPARMVLRARRRVSGSWTGTTDWN